MNEKKLRCEWGMDYDRGHYDCNEIADFSVNSTPYCFRHYKLVFMIYCVNINKFNKEIKIPISEKATKQSPNYKPPPLNAKKVSDAKWDDAAFKTMRIEVIKKMCENNQVEILLSDKNNSDADVREIKPSIDDMKKQSGITDDLNFIIVKTKNMMMKDFLIIMDFLEYRNKLIEMKNTGNMILLSIDEYELYKTKKGGK